MADAMMVARRAMPARGRGGSSTRAARNERDRRVICSIRHGLVGEDAFVHVPCSCDVHRGCALGFVEHAISRPRVNGASTLTYQVTCPNPTLHEIHREVDLQSLLQQIRGVGRSADTAEERAIRARVTAAELRPSRTPTGSGDLSGSAAERGEEDILGRLARHDPSAAANGSAMQSLWGAQYRTSEVCVLRVDRSHGVRCRKRTMCLRKGRRPIRGGCKERIWVDPSENVPPDGDYTEDTTTV